MTWGYVFLCLFPDIPGAGIINFFLIWPTASNFTGAPPPRTHTHTHHSLLFCKSVYNSIWIACCQKQKQSWHPLWHFRPSSKSGASNEQYGIPKIKPWCSFRLKTTLRLLQFAPWRDSENGRTIMSCFCSLEFCLIWQHSPSQNTLKGK